MGRLGLASGQPSPWAGILGAVPSREVESEAAETIRAVLAAIEAGELTADTPRAVALVRRLEGALVALEQVAKQP